MGLKKNPHKYKYWCYSCVLPNESTSPLRWNFVIFLISIILWDLLDRNFLILTLNNSKTSEIAFISWCVELLHQMCNLLTKKPVQVMLDQCFYGFRRVPFRSSKRRRPSCLLGARPGHPVLPQLQSWVHCQAVQAPLPRLWPRSVRRLLAWASGRALAGLGPPRARVRELQPETGGPLTRTVFPLQSPGENHLLSQLAVCRCFTSVPLMALSRVLKEALWA